MSLAHSYSIDSTSSTATISTLPLANDLANNLYDDHDHFQAIFTNDSRFFDTSLHIFKSYCNLGYIQLKDERSRQLQVPFMSIASFRGRKNRWRPRLFTSHSHNEHENGALKAFLTPTLLRRSNYSASNQSDSGISTTEPRKSPQPSSVPTITITDDNEPEVVITRL